MDVLDRPSEHTNEEDIAGNNTVMVREETDQNVMTEDRDIILESFFYILTSHIDNFKHLVNLHLKVFIVIGQPVLSLAGIEKLKNLTELWVCESKLQDASSVNECTRLKKLLLYSNHLQTIPKMTNLNKLTNLSVASNHIVSLSPVFPESLRELNLADNSITDLSDLVMCKHLEILNLAGNNISTLTTLGSLMKLPKLRYLYLVDRVYKFSPVSSLINYRSHTIYSLEHLKYLDGVMVEDEERENCKIFYEKKFRYYQVLHSNYLKASFVENGKLSAQSYSVLSNLRNAIMNVTLTLNRSSESSTIGKECRKKQQKYEVSQFYWDCKHRDWYPRLNKEVAVKCLLLEMEMSQYGNVNFFCYSKDAEVAATTMSDVMCTFVCPYIKRNMKLLSVEIDQVVQITNAQHHCFNKFRGVKEILGIGVMESQFFIVNFPVQINDTANWPFSFIKDYINLQETEKLECRVTNSLAIADAEWLDKNSLIKNSLTMKDKLNDRRVVVIGYVISDELMGSFTREATATMHLKFSNEPPEHCYHCAIYTSVIPENVIPVFIIEYRYIFEDTHFLTFEEDFFIPDGESVIFKHISASSKFNTSSWQNLSSLNLSKCLLTSFGPLVSFENVVELDLSYNHFSSLLEIGKLFPKLVHLNADFNDIRSTNIGRGMICLKSLNLKYNKLTKFLLSLQWLKKYCKMLEKLEVAYNPFSDVHEVTHLKYLITKYFPEFRKLDDEWLEGIQHDQMVYRFCIKDFPTVILSHSLIEEIKAKPKISYNGAMCLQDNCVPTSHCALNNYREPVCIFIINGKPFQNIDIDNKKTSLRWLTIKNNLLSSVEVLSECSKIEELDLSYNLLQSLSSVFKTLKHLVKLDLMCNYLRDLDSFLKFDFPNLRLLNLSYNFIKKLDGLKLMKTLEELYVAGNEIRKWENLQFIKEWKRLKVIDISENFIDDQEMLRKFLIYHGTQLEYINGAPVSEEEVTDANDTLSGTLNKNYLAKIYKPNQIRLLTELTVKKCGLRKTNFRDPDFQNLTSVNLESNALTTLTTLSYLKQMKHLCLTNNKITSFGDVKRTFDSLETLYLNFNDIADLVPLEFERFPKLIALYLQDNQLISVEGLKELKRLQYLVLDRNKLSNVKPEEMQMEALEELYMESNQIKDLSFIKNLRTLKKLFVAYNKIHDQSSLDNLSILKKLNELTVYGNPVCRLNNHYLMILTIATKLSYLDGHCVELQEHCNKESSYLKTDKISLQ